MLKLKLRIKLILLKTDSDWPNLDNGSKVEPSVFELNISEEVPILNINLKGNYTTQQLKNMENCFKMILKKFQK